MLLVTATGLSILLSPGGRGGGAGQARAQIAGGGRGQGANSNSGLKTERTQWLALIEQLNQK